MMHVKLLQPFIFFTLGFPLLLAGCGSLPLEKESPDVTLTPYFIAPAESEKIQVPQPQATPPATIAEPCINGLTFVADLSVPDGITAGSAVQLKKLWKVQNSGTCDWDSTYSFRLISGMDMGTQTIQPLYPARAGTEAIIEIAFTTPAEAGNFAASWQTFDPQGNPFGDPLFIDIIVVNN